MTEPRCVLLTGDSTEHRYVAHFLAQTGLLTALVIVRPPPTVWLRRALRSIRRFGVVGTLGKLAVRLILRLTGEGDRRRHEVRQILGEVQPISVERFDVTGVNTQEAREVLQKLKPDVLAVYGTSVVGDKTLATAGVVALNLHTGISPRYRGADCSFWPLHNREPSWLGATVHECTSNLDGGAIYAVRPAQIRGDEGVGGVFARCVEVGARAYADVIREVVEGRAHAEPQDLTTGREYTAAMRGLRAEFRVWRLVRSGLLGEATIEKARPDR